LRDGAFVLNTARGGIVDEEALLRELTSGRLLAALDVFHQEPLELDSPLRSLPNVFLSPHIAALTIDTLFRQGQMMVDENPALCARRTAPVRVTPEKLATMAETGDESDGFDVSVGISERRKNTARDDVRSFQLLRLIPAAR